MMSRDFMRRNSPFWATAWMFLYGSVLLTLASLPQMNADSFPTEMSSGLWTAILYNILLGTILTYFLNSWTLTKVNPSVVTLFFYLQPVIGVLNGWFSLGEIPTERTWFAMFCIFLGVGIGALRKVPGTATVAK
jgi:drug/metabolite transporter (DMT)-like permease